MRYTYFSNNDGANITVQIDGDLLSASSEHPHFDVIRDKVFNDDVDGLVDLFDPSKTVAEKFSQLSDRVSVAGGRVFFDGDQVDNVLSGQILSFVKEGVSDWQPLVAFYDRLMTNLNGHTRGQLYRWLADRQFEITPDGKFLAYKGLNPDLGSVHAGPAVVDGVAVNGHVPNQVGSTITFPRSQVDSDSAVGCSTGLHAGTWEYASSFGSVVVKVLIDPVDVVSVPTDCEDQKLRVCKYKVLEIVESKSNGLVDDRWPDSEDTANDDDSADSPDVEDVYSNYHNAWGQNDNF